MADLFLRRHYLKIAQIIAALEDDAMRDAVTGHFTVQLRSTSSKYDPAKFAEEVRVKTFARRYVEQVAVEETASQPVVVLPPRSRRDPAVVAAAVEAVRREPRRPTGKSGGASPEHVTPALLALVERNRGSAAAVAMAAEAGVPFTPSDQADDLI